ncbi:MAG: BON domain-containing protein [Pyrinomonadaceae bacterium]
MKTASRMFTTGLSLLLLAGLLAGCNRGPSDDTVTQNVRAKISADAPLSTEVITVSTVNGVVTLAGMVKSEADKSRAEQLARSVEGVKSVINTLTPKPASIPVIAPDDPLKTQVLGNLGKYGITGISVTVANGEVTLEGDLPRAKLQDALKAANEAHPKRVNNKLNIK